MKMTAQSLVLPIFCRFRCHIHDGMGVNASTCRRLECGDAMTWFGAEMASESRNCFRARLLRISAVFSGASVAALVLVFSTATGTAAQDFRAGRQAYDRSDYIAAFAEWRPLAETGHADAQASLGYLYLRGLGVAQNDAMAARWYAQAAARGQVDALHFLGTLYLKGAGVRRDYSRAHVLCELAMTRGAPRALRCRDEAISNLNEETLGENYRQIADWSEKFDALAEQAAPRRLKEFSQRKN